MLRELSKAIVATLVFFAIVESLLRATYFIRNSMVAYVPLPYMIGDEYGPAPPWSDGLRILEPDEVLIWRNRANLRRRYIDVFSPPHTEEERTSLLRQFLPPLPGWARGNPMWEISLNSEGFRDADFPKGKSPSTFRIICLGDSWTFGANVGQEEAYPQRLRGLLKREFPEADFEVLNLGVLGYSSYQGLELLRRRIVDMAPDVALIGFAMNDASVAGYRDKDVPPYKASLVAKIEAYKLLRYLALILKDKPKSISDHLRAVAESDGQAEFDYFAREGLKTPEEYEKLEPWTRVSLKDYEKNILEMIDGARHRDAGVMLLYNELWGNSPYRTVLEKIARVEGVPLIDSSALIAGARRTIEEGLEGKLDLRSPPAPQARGQGEIEVVFRVYAGNRPVPKAVSIVGPHPKLGNLVPNKITMYDDGTHGDQRGGDHVWSYAATFAPGTRVFYVYTNSGQEGKWKGLDVPWIRSFTVDAPDNGGIVYRPIDSFGKIHLLADGWHTDASGYELIAKQLLEVLKGNEKVQEYLRRVRTGGR